MHAWAEALRRRQIERLDELADVALDMVRAIRAAAAEPDADLEALNRGLSKAGRCLRLTGQLQSRLLSELEQAVARSVYLRARQAQADEPPAPYSVLDRHKDRVTRIVGRIAEREHRGDDDEVERLTNECAERLEDEDVYGEVGHRTVAELVRMICQDLDLDERPFLHEAWAVENSQPPSTPSAEGGPLADRSQERAVEGSDGRADAASSFLRGFKFNDSA